MIARTGRRATPTTSAALTGFGGVRRPWTGQRTPNMPWCARCHGDVHDAACTCPSLGRVRWGSPGDPDTADTAA